MKIMLDAGHAGFGVTPGKRVPDGSMYEWDFNAAVVKYMMEMLSNYEDVQVYRADDPTGKTDVPLQVRTDKANQLKVDLFFSNHANADGDTWSVANGVETYVWIRNNELSLKLARVVQANLVKATGLRDRGVKTADFHVLRETTMTAVLVEHAFMSNRAEAEKLKSDEFRRLCASSNVESIVSVYGLKKKSRNIFFYTGGYAGNDLVKVLDLCCSWGWWFDPTRKDDGTLMFKIGGFAEGSEASRTMENFLKSNGYWYQIQ
ncbi:N-acetylmuramoyl-L-alanine amidase [Neobacillus massiliamazoniensis]|uniref:N-acetylmuramoyl-L-alanine amidase n=1 Tax=Neobacillus massiliamazoniensis TaxID=1499688 RepID=A0A0U1NQH8_9BACI|nr:N-acetylmuramoyl-L-alanine amidase [Neobacillus massiliamazoniensis]CRK80294.1 N-acetylmuramoyl-L-alanine amidase [Neobacillus massiliamazoniensis]